MLDFDKIIKDYMEYIYNRDYYKKVKPEPHIFYMTHMDEIDPYIEEYYEYENSKNKKESNKLLDDHPLLKIYLTLEMEKAIFESRMKSSLVSDELKTLGRCVTYIFFKKDLLTNQDIKCFAIYDIDNNVEHVYENPNEKVIDYIKKGLMKLNLFVADIYHNEISLVNVIYSDIKQELNNDISNSKVVISKINKELLRARVFDSGIMLNDNEGNLPSTVDQYREIIKLYDEGIIDKDEYYIRLYKSRILSECDVIKMFINADEEQRNYIIDAYLELSSSSKNNKSIHIRTASREINEQVLERRRKKADTM